MSDRSPSRANPGPGAPVPSASTATRAWLDTVWSRPFLIDAPEPIASWARKNITLSEDESLQFPGPYDAELSPTAMVLFDFLEDPEWREFIGVKSSQIGFTLAMLVALCHKGVYNPQATIICLNSREEIKRVGTQRLQPMLRACKPLAGRIPEDEDKMQNLTLYLHGMTIYLVTAQSAGSLANKSVGLVVGDEVDEWPEELRGGESNALDLLRDRIKRVEDAKLVVFSKPKNEDDIIWPEYLTGSRHKLFVPCPHCTAQAGELAGYQELVWEQVRFGHCRDPKTQRWDYLRLIDETHYECIHCKGIITNKDKPWMLDKDNRRSQPTNLSQDDDLPVPRKFSCHSSDLYNLPHVPESTWGHLAKEWVSCKTRSQRMRFRRSRLGLPESTSGASRKLKLTDILNLQGTYERGHCSRPPVFVTLCVDVQKDCKKWVKAVFYADDTMEIVDHGVTLTFAALLVEADKPVIVDDWGDTPEADRIDPVPELGLIDEGDGHYTKTVLNFCTSKGAFGLFWPAKGRAGLQTLNMKDLVDYQKNNVHNGRKLPRWVFNKGAFLEDLYDERIALNKDIRKAKLDNLTPPAPQLLIYRAPDSEFCIEFTSERRWTDTDEENHKKRKKPGSRRKPLKVGDWFHDKSIAPNDFADAAIECLVVWYRVRHLFVQDEPEPEPPEDEEQSDPIDTPEETFEA